MKLAEKNVTLCMFWISPMLKNQKNVNMKAAALTPSNCRKTRIFKDGYFKVQDVHNDLAKNPRRTICFVLWHVAVIFFS